MQRYFATFPAGTWNIISRSLKGYKVSELKIVENDDSSVIFDTSLSAEKLIEIRYFTNVYLVIDNPSEIPESALKGKHFRLMMLDKGEPKPILDADREKIEKELLALGLKSDAHLSRNDFYIIKRSSESGLLTLRLPRAKFKREVLPAGELRPELTHILCLAAGLKPKDTLLDMFAGYGAIPLEAVRGFGCKKVIAVDNTDLSNRREYESIEWHTADAKNLSFIANNSIDRIITDPPWGVYDSKVDVSELYAGFSQEMARVLKPGGIAVLLTGFQNAEERLPKKLKLINEWNVLVSGKKAKTLKLQKLAR